MTVGRQPIPPYHQPEEDATFPVGQPDALSREALCRAFDRIAMDTLYPVAVGLAATYLAFVPLNILSLDRTNGYIMAVWAALTAAVVGGLGVLLKHWTPPLHWSRPLGASLALVVLLNTLLQIDLTRDLEDTTYLMLMLIGAAFFVLARRWLVVVIASMWIGWGLVVGGLGFPEGTLHYGTGLAVATVLAALVHVVHTRSLARVETLLQHDAHVKAELGQAVWESKQNEARFLQLSMAAFEGIVIHHSGVIVDANLALGRLLGCTPDELFGQTFLDLFAPETRPVIEAHILGGREDVYEAMLLKRSGEAIPVEMRGRTVPYQGTLSRVVAVRDISQRMQAEQALREAKDYAERLYRIVPAAIFTVDMEGTVTSVNDRAATILGYAPAEMVGHSCRTFALTPCTELCYLCCPDDASSRTPSPVHNVETIMRTKHGDIRTVLKNIELLLAPDGTPVGAIESFEDITERKRSEDQLRKLSLAVEQSSGIVVITDPNGTIEYVNARFTQVTGYTAAEAIGRNPRILKSGQVAPSVYEELWETILAGGDWHGEFLNRKKNGELYWEQAHISPIRDRSGRITQFIALKEDITRRKQAEQALQESLFRSQVLYHASSALMGSTALPDVLQAVVDNAVMALYADRVMLHLFDLDRRTITQFFKGGPGAHQIVQDNFDELWHGLVGWSLREGMPALSPKAKLDPRESPDVQQRRIENECGDIIVAPLLYRGTVTGTLTAINAASGRSFTAQDVDLLAALANQSVITIDNARLVESLRQSEEKFSKAFKASPDGLTITTLDSGDFVEVNDGFLAIMGYDRAETLGTNSVDLGFWADDADRQRLLDALAAHGVARDLEATMRRKSGEIAYGLISSEEIELDGQRLLLSIIKDMTEHVLAAREREQLIQELDAFARTVAHDLKNPLSPIIGYSEMLLDDFDALSPDTVHTYVQEIADSGQRMGNIIDELLLLARMRQREVQPIALEMGRIVNEACRRLDYIIKEFGGEIVAPDSWPQVMGYGPWIEEVWVNYISNALKYGGRPPRIELGATPLPGGMIRFWVRDNGAGLTPEQQALLFTPFTQLAQVHIEGHGLGLSIVERIVNKLGGEVGVESQIGEGSLFYFSLPEVPPDPAV